MTDSRRIEGQTPTIEISKAKTLHLREWFAFFDKPVPSAENEIIETADIEDQGQSVGALVGRIFTGPGESISATGMHVAFTIHKGKDNVNTDIAINRQYDPFGARFETPVIYMTFSSGKKYASLGTHQGSGKISFTNWIEVKKDDKEDKSKIIKQVQQHKAQSLPFRLHELIEAKYKIT